MTRRKFIPTAGIAAGAGLAADTPQNAIIELRRVQLRTSGDNQRDRPIVFLDKHALPAFQKAGAGPAGFFASSIGPNTPFILCVVSYPSLAAMEQIRGKMAADTDYQRAVEAFNSRPGLNYVRIDSSLLRTFDSFPTVGPP